MPDPISAKLNHWNYAGFGKQDEIRKDRKLERLTPFVSVLSPPRVLQNAGELGVRSPLRARASILRKDGERTKLMGPRVLTM